MKKEFKKVLLILLVCCFAMVGCGKNNNNANLKTPKNVKADTYISSDKTTLIVKVTNQSGEDIPALDVSVSYPNKDDLIADDYAVLTNLKGNATTYVALSLPINQDFDYYVPDTFDVNVSTESDNLVGLTDTSSFVDKIKAEYSVGDNEVEIDMTNDTGKIIGTVDCILVYFKDGKPVGADTIEAIDVEDEYYSDRDVLYTGDLDNPKYIDYDNIELYINGIFDNYGGIEDVAVDEE